MTGKAKSAKRTRSVETPGSDDDGRSGGAEIRNGAYDAAVNSNSLVPATRRHPRRGKRWRVYAANGAIILAAIAFVALLLAWFAFLAWVLFTSAAWLFSNLF